MCNGEHTFIVPASAATTYDEPGIALSQILDDYSQRGELLPQDCIHSMASSILGSLAKGHDCGRAYGVVTPDDIMLRAGQGFSLVDSRADMLSWHEIRSRAIYVAPEFFDGNWVAASDVFCVGVITWQCLMGLHPFVYQNSEDLNDVGRHIREDPPLLPAAMAGRYEDMGLLALATVMLAKEPDRRPSCDVLMRALHTGRARVDGDSDTNRRLLPVVKGNRMPPEKEAEQLALREAEGIDGDGDMALAQ